MTPQEHIEQDLAETLEKQRLEKEKLEQERRVIAQNAALLLECLNSHRSERPKKDPSSADSKNDQQLPASDLLLDAILPVKAIRAIVVSYLGLHFVTSFKSEDRVLLEQLVDFPIVFEETAKRQIMQLFHFANRHCRNPEWSSLMMGGVNKSDSSALLLDFMDSPNEFIRICSDRESPQLKGTHLQTLWDIFSYLFNAILQAPRILRGDYQPDPSKDFIVDECMPLLCAAYDLHQLGMFFDMYIEQKKFDRAALTLDAGLVFDERHLKLIEKMLKSAVPALDEFPLLLFEKVTSQQPHFFRDPQCAESLRALINYGYGVGALQAAGYLVLQGTPLPSNINIQNELAESLQFFLRGYGNQTEAYLSLKSAYCDLLKALFAREDFQILLKAEGVHLGLLEGVISVAHDQKEIMTAVEKLLRDLEVKIYQHPESKEEKDILLLDLLKLAVKNNLPMIVSCLLDRGVPLPGPVVEIPQSHNFGTQRARSEPLTYPSLLEWAYNKRNAALFRQIATLPNCLAEICQAALHTICKERDDYQKEFLDIFVSIHQQMFSRDKETARAWVAAVIVPLMKKPHECLTVLMLPLLLGIRKTDPQCFDNATLWQAAIDNKDDHLLNFLIEQKIPCQKSFITSQRISIPTPLDYAKHVFDTIYMSSFHAFMASDLMNKLLEYQKAELLKYQKAGEAKKADANTDQKDINGATATKKAVTTMTGNGTSVLWPVNDPDNAANVQDTVNTCNLHANANKAMP